MAGQEKTEQPTPRALRKARERGEVSRSQDVISLVILLIGLGALLAQLPEMQRVLKAMILQVTELVTEGELTNAKVMNAFAVMLDQAAALTMPVLLALLVAAFVGSFFQVGPLLVFDPLKPTLKKLNAVAGLKRMFFEMGSYVELAKGALKLAVVGIVAAVVLRNEMRTVLRLPLLPLDQAMPLVVEVITQAVKHILIAFLAIAVIDFIYQRWKFNKDHMMTKEQVKEEYKSQEGDPQHKSARKRLHEEINSNMTVAQTEKADVIVTNPTHIACAVRYDPNTEGSPRLLAKGTGHIAKQIRSIAKDLDIPIVRDVGLARALNQLDEGTQIPDELYDAAAEVLRWVETLAAAEGKLTTWQQADEQGQAAAPASY